jgi:hypothetical protein
VIGAAKGATKVGEQAVIDAYAALKHIVLTSYGKAADLIESISGLEKKPDSQARRDTVAEELKQARALDDPTLLAAAEALLKAAEESGSRQTIGIDWQDVKAARVKIGQIRAREGAIGFRAARMEVIGEVEITGVDVGGSQGK